ncbi:MAG: glycosyltransferase [Candidatus Aenigmatarchaeota archaeon]
MAKKKKQKNRDIRVSVIIPTLNEDKYIEPTLFHIKRQNPYEIILGDSYSDDGTVKIAKKYGAKVAYAPRGAASIGRNAAAKKAKGDVLLFLDADTIAYPNMLETIKKDFKDRRIAGWTCTFYAFSPYLKDHVMYTATSDLIKFLVEHVKPHAAGFNIAVRRSVFEKINGFDESLKVMEDHDLTWRVSKHGKFKFSTETCVFTSVRRLSNWGRWGLFKKYSKIYLGYILKNKKYDTKNVRYEPIR